MRRLLEAIRRWHSGQLAVLWLALAVALGWLWQRDGRLTDYQAHLYAAMDRRPSADTPDLIQRANDAARRRLHGRNAAPVLLLGGFAVTWAWFGGRRRA
jgi:hypothetical protein